MKLDQWTDRIFNPNSAIMRIAGKYADLMLLNLLWIVCSLPLITLGASSAALFQGADAVRTGIGKPVKRFLETFRARFWKATAIWGIFLLIGACLIYNFALLLTLPSAGKLLLGSLCVMLTLVYLVCLLFSFPILARYDLSVGQTLKAAFFTGMSRLDLTLLILALHLALVVFAAYYTYYFLYTLALWLLAGFALVALADSCLMAKIFARIDPPKKKDIEGADL